MNTKKFAIMIVSLALAATSAFAWSKKSENTGNLGRMFLSVSGGVNMQKGSLVKGGGGVQPLDMSKSSPTGAAASFVINAPIFKPGVNAFRNIKWAGIDGQLFFNYNYSGDYSFNWLSGINNATQKITQDNYSLGATILPYLNFETDLPFLKAIKPFGIAYAGYQWEDTDCTLTSGASSSNYGTHDNYFIYGVGGGVEFVILDELSFTPTWKWNASSQSGIPCYQTVGAELAYWMTDQFCISAFWEHSFGGDYSVTSTTPDTLSVKHGDVFGAKIKIGFMR